MQELFADNPDGFTVALHHVTHHAPQVLAPLLAATTALGLAPTFTPDELAVLISGDADRTAPLVLAWLTNGAGVQLGGQPINPVRAVALLTTETALGELLAAAGETRRLAQLVGLNLQGLLVQKGGVRLSDAAQATLRDRFRSYLTSPRQRDILAATQALADALNTFDRVVTNGRMQERGIMAWVPRALCPEDWRTGQPYGVNPQFVTRDGQL